MVDTVSIAPAAGLPDILIGGVVAPVALLTSDALGVLSALGSSPWGIYQGGSPIVVADTVTDFGYGKAYAVSNYPIEDGGFASYDKVEQPYEVRIRFASGGDAGKRQALIDSVDAIASDLNLYDIVTPDAVYMNGNVTRPEYRRTNTDGGASMLQVDVTVEEIRILSGQAMTNTADPSSAAQQNGGTVQPGIGSDAVAGGTAGADPVTTPPPATLGGGVGGLPVTQTGGGIGSA